MDGRLDFGVGRGYQPSEFAGFGLPMVESRERFDESLEIIRRAWTEDEVNFEGKFYQIRGVRVMPKPVQKPHPPLWGAAVSPESFDLLARRGLRFLSAPSITPTALMAESYRTYRRVWLESGHDAADLEVPALHFTDVGETDPGARRDAEQSVMWYFRTIAEKIAAKPGEPVPPDYGFYARARRHLETVTYEQLYRDVLLFGDPGRVIERIHALQEDLGVTSLLCWTNFGGLPSELARASIRRFAEKVIPKFR